MLRFGFEVALVASLGTLTACSAGTSPAKTSSGVVPLSFAGRFQSAGISDKNCGSAGNVVVKPCPIRLTRNTKDGIVVTVSGPGVVSSYLGRLNSCFSGKTCYFVEREGNSQTKWRFTSGTVCGGADVEFDGVNASGSEVGYTFLGLRNAYCR